jgi:hypothetical protein
MPIGPRPSLAETRARIGRSLRGKVAPEHLHDILEGDAAGEFLEIMPADDQAPGLTVHVAESCLGRYHIVKSNGHALSPSSRESFMPDLPDGQS